MAVDFKSLGKYQQGALVAGGLAVILSFFNAYIRVSGGGRSANVTNAWDGWGALACILLVAAVAIVAIRTFASEVLPKEVPFSLISLAAAALATLILVIKPFTVSNPYAGIADISIGPGWSGWILFVALIAFTVFAAFLFRESGEKIPELPKKDTAPPTSGETGAPPAASNDDTPPAPPVPPAV